MLDFENFFVVPETFEAEGFVSADAGVKSIFLAGPDFDGKQTRTFAWYGIPEGATEENPVPGIVLVHGGNGSAYSPWVKMWNDRGFAAIAIDMFGGIPAKDGAIVNFDRQAPRYEYSTPGITDTFQRADEAPQYQWPYFAIASIISANSFLSSLEGVAAGRIGITGISWGGYATTLAASFDSRFKFAVPVYGCGGFMENTYLVPETISISKLKQWVSLWEPDTYLANAKMPFLWVNGTADAAFNLKLWSNSASLTQKAYRAIRINMPHGQTEGMNIPEILPFAKAMVSGTEFPGFTKIKIDDEGERLGAKWNSSAKIKSAQLIATRAAECWNDCLFRAYPAKLNKENGTVIGNLPEGWTAAYLNLEDENGCVYSSEVFFN